MSLSGGNNVVILRLISLHRCPHLCRFHYYCLFGIISTEGTYATESDGQPSPTLSSGGVNGER